MEQQAKPTLQQMAATPHAFEYEGEEYLLSPLGVNELAAMEEWASYRPFEKVREKLDTLRRNGIKGDFQQTLIDAAERASNDMRMRASEMNSIAGIKQAIYLGFKKNHPELKKDLFEKIVAAHGLNVLQDIMEKHNELPESKN